MTLRTIYARPLRVDDTNGVRVAPAANRASDVTVAAAAGAASGSAGVFRLTVNVGASGFNDESALAISWLHTCTAAIQTVNGTVAVLVQLASPTEASLGASATSLTNADDPAATVGVANKITLSAVLKFDDGSTKTMTTDARTVFTVTAGSDLVFLVDNKLYAVAGTSGSATVTLSFTNYSGAAALTASRTVTAGPNIFFSQRHRVPSNSRDEGSKCIG